MLPVSVEINSSGSFEETMNLEGVKNLVSMENEIL